jgi:hypothetical protein
MPYLFVETKVQKSLAIFGSILGVITGVSYVGVAFTPLDVYQQVHIDLVHIGFTSFFLVVIVYLFAIFLNKNYSNFYAYIFIVFAVILILNILLMFWGPEADTAEGVMIQATGQKIVVFSAITCMFIQGFGAWNIEKQRAQR